MGFVGNLGICKCKVVSTDDICNNECRNRQRFRVVVVCSDPPALKVTPDAGEVSQSCFLFLSSLICTSDSKAKTSLYSIINSQPRPQGLLLVQNGGRRTPWPRLPKWLQKFVRISSHKHDQMSSFCLNNGFRLQKTNRAARRWKQPPKKPFHYVSRDKILHDSWSISAALARGFTDRHFERGEGPGHEVDKQHHSQVLLSSVHLIVTP